MMTEQVTYDEASALAKLTGKPFLQCPNCNTTVDFDEHDPWSSLECEGCKVALTAVSPWRAGQPLEMHYTNVWGMWAWPGPNGNFLLNGTAAYDAVIDHITRCYDKGCTFCSSVAEKLRSRIAWYIIKSIGENNGGGYTKNRSTSTVEHSIVWTWHSPECEINLWNAIGESLGHYLGTYNSGTSYDDLPLANRILEDGLAIMGTEIDNPIWQRAIDAICTTIYAIGWDITEDIHLNNILCPIHAINRLEDWPVCYLCGRVLPLSRQSSNDTLHKLTTCDCGRTQPLDARVFGRHTISPTEGGVTPWNSR